MNQDFKFICQSVIFVINLGWFLYSSLSLHATISHPSVSNAEQSSDLRFYCWMLILSAIMFAAGCGAGVYDMVFI